MRVIQTPVPLSLKSRQRPHAGLPIALLLALAAVLYLYQLGTESLWLDEVFSIRDANQLLNHPNLDRPIYYILLRIWMIGGTGEAWLRGLSVLFGLGSIFLIYQLGCRVAGQVVGIIAASLLMLSSLFIYHAQEVRMYTLSTFLSLAGTLVLMQYLASVHPSSLVLQRDPLKRSALSVGERSTPLRSHRAETITLVGWVVLRLLSCLTAPLNGLILAVDMLLIGYHCWGDRRRLWQAAIGIVAILAGWMPFVLLLGQKASGFMSGWIDTMPAPDLASFPKLLAAFITAESVPWLGLQSAYILFVKVFAIALFALVVVALWLKPRSTPLLWMALWAFGPQVLIFAISYLVGMLWLERYLLFTAPYALVLIAVGFVKLWDQLRVAAIAALVMYAIAITAGLVPYYTQQTRTDWRAAAAYIQQHYQPNDLIILTSDAIIFDYYYQGDIEKRVMEEYSTEDSIPEVTPDELDPLLGQLAAQGRRLWFTYSNNPAFHDESDLVKAAATQHQFQLVDQHDFAGLDLRLMQPPR